MQKYKNLPSINVDIQDGNLKLDKALVGPVTLIVGTATDGPNASQYLVSDSNAAALVFGSTSPIIQRMAEAKLGGAKNILLYRVGGVSASIQGLFGSGSEITTIEANVASNTKYKVYIGPNPTPSTSDSVLIIFKGNTIVYSNVPGAEVASGLFTITGFDTATTLTVGTPTAPVAFNLVQTTATVSTTGPVTHTPYTAIGNGTTTSYTFAASSPTPTVTAVKLGGSVVTTGFTVTGNSISFTTAPAGAETIEVDYTTVLTVTGPVPGSSYIIGADNVNCTLQKYYQLLAEAYIDLETTPATQVIPDRATLDAPNLADGSTASDKLTYLSVSVDGFGNNVYTWSTSKILYQLGAGTTTVVGSADVDNNGQPIIAQTFSEVNFAHQLATFCNNVTDETQFILGFIGTSAPTSTSNAAIAKWLGSLPQTDAFGAIVEDGSGLLGNKFMVGTLEHSAGFFATDSGFPDGNVLTDTTNNVAVDIGKFLSVIAAQIVTPNSSTIGTTAAIVNSATVYGALSGIVTPGNSTTNVVVNGVALPYIIKKSKLDELTFAKYVTLNNTPNGVAVVSGSLATTVASDYQYISTSIIVADIVTKIRNRLSVYLGKGINQALLAAATTAVNGILQDAVTGGSIVNYAFTVSQGSNQYSLSVPLKIVPVFELRTVDLTVSLAFSI